TQGQSGPFTALVSPIDVLGRLSALDDVFFYFLIPAGPVAELHRDRRERAPQRRPFGLIELLERSLCRQSQQEDRATDDRALELPDDEILDSRPVALHESNAALSASASAAQGERSRRLRPAERPGTAPQDDPLRNPIEHPALPLQHEQSEPENEQALD